ncbi:phosphopantetheinyl transferase [Dothidotthia symphoricarpi CBS 119687]|uniref:holo-[acyl-carrier-protein] synthase n=1 Tax=Dothidotthia symphoricarpi CBS 119687 TaxID=1392245 RepID=A0A6A5ZZI3_9PLEO|nr:phosphopantetheinyl transferase [Dothidotthia symphoricarpi CBS 119687]KAF2124304.1 phosphopantetheinyl transferase [Dothidotthia symphoricarpi CBS 119687]
MPNASPERGLTCWLLDTRPLWPGTKIAEAVRPAPEALSLISPSERQTCLRKYHIADAKMSLASALLKRLFIHLTLSIPWSSITLGRKRDPTHGKPCALIASGTSSAPAPVEFNVSHQAGLVVLVGCRTDILDVDLGVDIVCVNERGGDLSMIDAEGWEAWVNMYAELFSPEESFDMKFNCDAFPLNDGTLITPDILGRHDRVCARGEALSVTLPNGQTRTFDSDLVIDAKLRRFYVFWAYKEAYIKLDGEALLANWIPQLEFKGVRAPRPGTPARCSTHGVWGERVGDTAVWFRHELLPDTRMEVCAFEENYMIGVAAKDRGWLGGVGREGGLPEVLTGFVGLHLESDVLEVARRGG